MPRIDNKMTVREKQNYSKYFDTGRIYMAKVMDTRNVSRAGEILVHIIGGDGDEQNPKTWMTAAYASSFFGTTPYSGSADGQGDSNSFESSPKSFGSWFPIPCVGNYVFVFFPVSPGENVNAYWFACPVDPSLNYMLPGIPGAFCNDEHKALTERKAKNNKPEDNKKLNQNVCDGEKQQSEYKPLNQALKRQGLNKDGIRGYSTAGAKRERPSMCYGILTPMGNSFVMDDGWSEDDNKTEWNFCQDKNSTESSDLKEKRELVGKDGKSPFNSTYGDKPRNNAGFRFRTRNGTQIMIGDDGTIYMINSDGTCWVEISEDGYLDAFSEKGINACSKGDINLHAFGNIFIEAGQTIGIRGKDIKIEGSGSTNIDSPHIITNSIVSAEEILAKKGNITTLTSGAANLKGTYQGYLKGTAYYAESSGIFPPDLKEKEIETPDAEVLQPQTLTKDDVTGERLEDGTDNKTKDTINTRVPTHEPYCGHKKYEPDGKINPTTDNNYDGTNNKTGTCGGSCNCGNNKEAKPIEKANENNNVTKQADLKGVKTSVDKPEKKDIAIPNEMLSLHFTLRQLCYSDIAVKKGINNNPNDEEKEELRKLSVAILEPIFRQYKNVEIKSGYRSAELYSEYKTTNESQHRLGQAVDIIVPKVSNFELATWIYDNLDFDQLILENGTNLLNDPNSGWVHISFKNEKENKKEVFTVTSDGTRNGLWEG